MDETNTSSPTSTEVKGIPWRHIGFGIAAVYIVLFIVFNRKEVDVTFIFFHIDSRQWVVLLVAVALGVVSDRLFIGFRRRRKKKD